MPWRLPGDMEVCVAILEMEHSVESIYFHHVNQHCKLCVGRTELDVSFEREKEVQRKG